MNNEINVKRAVLHVLDINSGMPVLSRGELEITGELSDYLGNLIDKMLEDSNLKNAVFSGEDSSILRLCKLLNDNEEDFLSITADAANKLFSLMQRHIDIPSADLVCCLLEINGARHLGIIKLNYKAGFTHWVNNSREGSINSIIRHKTLLPQEGQKLEECALVNLSDFGIKLMEKQYEINGEKEYYLAKYYLQCGCQLSDNAKLKILDKVTKSINKKYFDEDFEKAIKVKKAVTESFDETSSIQIDRIADQVFEKDISIRHEYVDEMEKAGLNEKEIIIPDRLIEKKFKTHKIKTDTGIEIDFPLEYAGNREKIEFVNNSDGT
ncbi:MAG: nucleoid-associated bacterial protein, partial [Clostridiales bacterium GWC2_40_7]